MEFKGEVKYERCPRCGNETYPVWPHEADPSWTVCLACGYDRTGLSRFVSGLIDGIVPVDDLSQSFSGVMFLKFKDGRTNCSSIVTGSTDSQASRFLELLKMSDIDPNGSYLNKWDEETKTIKRFNPNRNLWY